MNSNSVTSPTRSELHSEHENDLDLQTSHELALQAAFHLAMIATCYTRALGHPREDAAARDWILDSFAHDAAPYAEEVLDHLRAIDEAHARGLCISGNRRA